MISARACASSILKNILVPGTNALGLTSQRFSVEFIPGQTGVFQGRRIVVVRNAARGPPDHAAMLGPQIVFVDGVASQASLI